MKYLPQLTVFLCFFAISTAPVAAQEDSESSRPTVDLPLVGEVPVPQFLASLFGMQANAQDDGEGGSGGQSTPPAVVWSPADIQPVTETFRFLGRIEPIERVQVQTRVPGFIERVAFEGGQTVDEGDTLFQIETDQYVAELQAAKASEQSARAEQTNAERALRRAEELRESGTVSEANLDGALAEFGVARGAVLQAQASVQQAQLNLDYTTIDAPIGGRMSAPVQTRGNYVSSATGEIAELTQMTPIWGVFALGENRLIEWQRLGIGGQGGAADEPERLSAQGYDLNLLLPDGSAYEDPGALAFVGNAVDADTGTVEVRVVFPNAEGLLLPGQNVTLEVTEADPPEYPVVPQAAVMLGRDGRAVWIVREDDTVTRRPVQVQPTEMPGQMAITTGLEGGERVVVRGTMSLSDGARVDPRIAGDEADASGGGGQ